MNIGFDKVYYSKITEDPETGYETYGTPKPFSKGVSMSVTPNTTSTDFYADDALDEVFEEFVDAKVALDLKEVIPEAAEDVLGVKIDANGSVVSSAEDRPSPVALLARSMRSDGKYDYYAFYRTKFGLPAMQRNTKGSSITINTPKLEGRIMRRHKPDYAGDHPWRIHHVDDGTAASQTVVSAWYNSVPEAVQPT